MNAMHTRVLTQVNAVSLAVIVPIQTSIMKLNYFLIVVSIGISF